MHPVTVEDTLAISLSLSLRCALGLGTLFLRLAWPLLLLGWLTPGTGVRGGLGPREAPWPHALSQRGGPAGRPPLRAPAHPL